ncbi:hypothetical protein ColTof4_07719 [Colletotrichum tofieldiae]|nr:hypothetical protein ColTof4_07719 [Colletotrichum tofieldiae]
MAHCGFLSESGSAAQSRVSTSGSDAALPLRHLPSHSPRTAPRSTACPAIPAVRVRCSLRSSRSSDIGQRGGMARGDDWSAAH